MEAKGSYCWPSRRARGGSSCRRFAAVCRWCLLPRRCSSQGTTWQRDQAPATACHPSALSVWHWVRQHNSDRSASAASAGANPSPACYCTPTPPQT
eukprot:scaffold52888_cov70-Phaeocystis_antarctica.AAC.16